MPPKKTKMSLNEFLGDATYGSWADEMEDFPTAPAHRSGDEPRGSALSRAPDRSERTFEPRSELPLPTQPPYTAFVGNLPFDITESDLADHFGSSGVKSSKIIRDREDKPKGFGYVEFNAVDGLKAALEKTGSALAGRTIRVSVADPPKERESNRPFGDRGDRDGSRGGFGGGPADEDRQWRRDGPLPPLNDERGERRGGGYDRPRGSRFGNGPQPGGPSDEDRGERMGFGSKFQASREPPPPSIAEETNDWRSTMKGPPTPGHQDKEKGGRFGGNERGGYAGGGGRRGSGRNTPTGVGSPKLGPADLEDKWTMGSRFKPSTSTNVSSPERAEGGGGPPQHTKKFGRTTTEDANDDVSDWRSAPRKVAPVPPSPGIQNNMARGASMERGPGMSAPTPTRRKLDLLPRSATNPTDPAGGLSSPKSTGEMTPVSATSVKPNPFGAAKPVDAAAREREITEKMERAKLAASAARQNTNSRPTSRQGSRQGSRAPSPTPRSPANKTVGLGLNTGDDAAAAPPAAGAGSGAGAPTPKILPRGSVSGPSGRGGGGGGGGSFGHGRMPSEGAWRRGGPANRDPPASSTAGNATNTTGGEDSKSTKPAGGANNGGSGGGGMERRASTVRPSFSFANAAAGAASNTNK